MLGIHAMFYSSEPEELRQFIKEKLGFKATDVGNGWLIFEIPSSEMGVHPVNKAGENFHQSGYPHISFICCNIHAEVKELKEKGVEFTDEIFDAGYGLTTHFKMPGNFEVELFQPHYKLE